MFVILDFLSLKTKGMLGDFLHVVAGSLHPVAEACSAHQLVPKELLHTLVSMCSSCRWHCCSALLSRLNFQAFEMQRDSSFRSDLRALLLLQVPVPAVGS